MYRYSEANLFRRAMRRSAEWKPMSLFYARTLHHVDALSRRASGGRVTFSAWVTGLPVVQLTTTGAKSGLPRTLPLLAIPNDDGLIVIASNYGQERNPAWYHNVKAHPEVTAEFEGRSRPMIARELEGDERERWYARGIDIYPGWIEYRKRTAGIRQIPVIELVPVSVEGSGGP